ncbi:PEGA domain-containing protein, partial [Clostridioides difficile]|uniref:PEGA domain-containing protein n=1 Tax=Clostridioides difficile TaxID=1496 RepID=UPI0018DD999C
FVVNEPGATVWIDDEVIGTTPIAKAVRVDLGSRRIVVRKPHFFDDGRDVVVSGAAEVTIAVTMRVEIHQGRLVVRAG